MMEAQNLSRLQQGQTPLLGGENPQLHESDFSGVTPKNFAAATPHPLAAGATPLPGATPALTGTTPSRAIAGAALCGRCANKALHTHIAKISGL